MQKVKHLYFGYKMEKINLSNVDLHLNYYKLVIKSRINYKLVID